MRKIMMITDIRNSHVDNFTESYWNTETASVAMRAKCMPTYATYVRGFDLLTFAGVKPCVSV